MPANHHGLALIAFLSIVPAGTTRAGRYPVPADESRVEYLGYGRVDRPELAGYVGPVVLNGQPILGLQPGDGDLDTLHRQRDHQSAQHQFAGRGNPQPGWRFPGPQRQWPDGPSVHRRGRNHYDVDGLSGRRRKGRVHFRQYGRLDFGVEGGASTQSSSRQPSPALRILGWRSAISRTAEQPSFTPPTRTAATSTSSIASWQKTGSFTDPNFAYVPTRLRRVQRPKP